MTIRSSFALDSRKSVARTGTAFLQLRLAANVN